MSFYIYIIFTKGQFDLCALLSSPVLFQSTRNMRVKIIHFILRHRINLSKLSFQPIIFVLWDGWWGGSAGECFHVG